MLANIQALRALAALFVVFVHAPIMADALGVPVHIREAFSTGVDLFFVISGFIMVYSTQNKPPSPRAFFLNRLARVAPIYWLMTTFVFALALAAPSLLDGTRADVVHLIKSYLFIPYERDDGFARPLLFLGWSLNYEMMFYVLFSIGLMLPRRFSAWFTISAIVALVIAGGLLKPQSIIPAFFTRPILLEFALGMLIAMAIPKLAITPKARPLALLAVAAGLPLLVFGGLLLPDAAFAVTALSAGAIVAGAVYLELAGLAIKSPTVIHLGDASYSLYLTHPFVTQAVGKAGQVLGLLSPIGAAALMLAAYIAAIAVALTSYRFVERPLSSGARKVLGLKRPKPPVGGL